MSQRSETDLSPQELITRHQAGVWRYLRLLGCDNSTADDLTQETFLTILRRPPFNQYSDEATAAYLRRIARNLFISLKRRDKRMHLVAAIESLDAVWDRWIGAEEDGEEFISALNECLQGLTDRAQLALRMRFTDDAKRVEIGDKLGITEHGAKNLVQRAKQQLKECVQTKLT
ncbi:ECF RNA polymerase sigma factor SigE [Rosistilla oblonga]|uniref:RNA polymerase sigma factor n=1 Tax=Rosistilla oblonga TaxID=2527990 RepID=A0A518IN85_9BACT|nr:sigma-70 family RNA polymerase sigma factor [Rosistilla oblonga]QDV10616.1 ECF RNA polymerase sigma factor SigE [Rosistilla oblonga]QDV54553.1 ECF RNA polymerase sigma factor SigE [Rosistilla oblonga]